MWIKIQSVWMAQNRKLYCYAVAELWEIVRRHWIQVIIIEKKLNFHILGPDNCKATA